ncbi:MAG: methyltransferase domain-containing protein [Planctomycetota bacterium]
MAQFPRRDYSGPPRRNRVSADAPNTAQQRSRPAAKSSAAPAAETAWENQAYWYDQLQGQGGADLYQQVLLPAVLKRLGAKKGQRVLDIGCGQGVLGRALAHLGVASLGVDASPTLIATAQARAGANEKHLLGDARKLGEALGAERFDHAAAVMVLQDMSPIDAVLAGAAAVIQPGGRLVMALTHPCFRQPKRTSWGWDDDQRQQYRRIDGYLSPYQMRIATHPGAARGTAEGDMETLSSHRPLSAYIDACGAVGLGITGCDELTNPRRGTKGSRYAAEDLAAREIPLFLVLTATKLR